MSTAQHAPMRPPDAVSKWNADLAFRAVVEATADKAGLEFMRHLVKNLARSLGVEYAFVAEFAGSEDRVKTIAFWSGDDWRSNVEYRLSGTPCERVVQGEFCLYKDDVQRLFLSGQKDEATALIPDELVNDMHIIGTEGYVKERVAEWEETGVTTLLLSCRTPVELRKVAEVLA